MSYRIPPAHESRTWRSFTPNWLKPQKRAVAPSRSSGCSSDACAFRKGGGVRPAATWRPPGSSQRQDRSGMSAVLQMTDKLETELPTMLSEHKEIVTALKTLIDAARAEDRPEYVHFAEKLMAHARMEEEVSYPAALVIGRYLKTVLTAE